MRVTKRQATALTAVLLAILFFCSCSGSTAPQVGTPPFYWVAAKETYATGEYFKTIDHLEKLSATDNQFTARARPWLLVMTAGMARGYGELADSFEAGARINRPNPTAFRRSANTYRGEANRLSLEFVAACDQFQKSKDESIPLAFNYPRGSAAPIMELTKVTNGIALQPAEIEPAEKRTIERAILLTTCRAVGAPDDPPKTMELFKAGNAQVPRATFVTAIANALYDQAQLYTTRKMDQPDKFKTFCNRALDALKTLPETKETKELSKKIQTALKKAKTS